MIDDTENAHILKGLFESCFPRWLRAYEKLIIKKKNDGSMQDDDEHYDAIIKLLSVAAIDAENIEVLEDPDGKMLE